MPRNARAVRLYSRAGSAQRCSLVLVHTGRQHYANLIYADVSAADPICDGFSPLSLHQTPVSCVNVPHADFDADFDADS